MSRPRREMPPAPSPSETYTVTRAQDAPAITQGAAREERTVEGAGGTNAPPAGPSGVCAAPAARPGTSRDSVQAVVLRGRHWRPVTSPMTQLGGRVECPSLPPWCTYHDEPSCLIAPSVETRPRAHVKARSRRYPACSCVPEDNNVTPRKVEVLVPVGALHLDRAPAQEPASSSRRVITLHFPPRAYRARFSGLWGRGDRETRGRAK